MSEYFDKLFEDFDEAAAEAAVLEADAEADRAARKAQSQRQMLTAYYMWKQLQSGATTALPSNIETPHLRHGTDRANSQTGRAAVMKAITGAATADEEWTIATIAEVLGLDEDAHRRLGVTLQRLVNDGALERPRKGLYKLPSAPVPAAAEEEREADSENGSRNGFGQAARSSGLFGLAGPAPS